MRKIALTIGLLVGASTSTADALADEYSNGCARPVDQNGYSCITTQRGLGSNSHYLYMSNSCNSDIRGRICFQVVSDDSRKESSWYCKKTFTAKKKEDNKLKTSDRGWTWNGVYMHADVAVASGEYRLGDYCFDNKKEFVASHSDDFFKIWKKYR
ncbi:hypothetical protein [Microbulbifer sp. TYP-18]|uniref:hypothetical protein n=1 Tax=Microbulbifer sp. TYP-18 TaxID=3230024 RepID=UPI0034C63BA5